MQAFRSSATPGAIRSFVPRRFVTAHSAMSCGARLLQNGAKIHYSAPFAELSRTYSEQTAIKAVNHRLMDKRKPPADDRAGLGRKSSLIKSSGEGLQKGESVAICFIYPNAARRGRSASCQPGVFIACEGAQDLEMAGKLDEAFRRGGSARVRSLRFGGPPSRADRLTRALLSSSGQARASRTLYSASRNIS